MLVFQGNAGSALDRTPFVRGFERLGWEVVLVDYPGYGARTGAPTQTSLTEAGLEALDQLRREDDRPVYLLGESLGSGVAAQVARQRPDAVRGLFLVTPFSSMADVAADHFSWVPARLLLRDRWLNPARRSRTTVVRSPCSSPGRTPWCRRGSAKRSSTDTGGRSDSGCNPTAATTRSTSTPRRHCGARCRHFSRTLNRTSRCSASALPSDLETGPAVCGSAT